MRASALVGLAVLAMAGPSLAHAGNVTAGSTDQLRVGIRGQITAKCTVTPTGDTTVSFGELLDPDTGGVATGALDLPFSLTCNAPYQATLSSENGGLAFQGQTVPGFANLLAYTAKVNLPAKAGNLSLDCESSQMLQATPSAPDATASSNCTGSSNNNSFSTGDGKIRLVLKSTRTPVLAGEYSDHITLQVSPILGGESG